MYGSIYDGEKQRKREACNCACNVLCEERITVASPRAFNFSNIKVFFIVSDKGELEVLLYLFYTIIFSTIAQAYFLHLRAFRDANNATSLIFV